MRDSQPGLRALAAMSGGYTTVKKNGRAGGLSARVFVVDDEDFIRDLYKDMFESRGHTVFSARDGDEAVRLFRDMPCKPDAIIMDHRMPNKDGIQTTKEIRELDASIPIIFSSADESIREEALDAGAVSFWTKPFPVGMLIDATMDIVKARKG
ncbi:MAG: response regulator [Thermoplasmata archaeon]|nr:response regulator [Thermoplasmata archaeon]MCJ7562709.1 response regulator [Thermoplasmata archaeon]TFG70310.1 MAG: response regulator [Methanomassiliicoccus sp.]